MRSPVISLLAVAIISLAASARASECSEYANVYHDGDGNVTRIDLRCDNCFEGATDCAKQRPVDEHGDVRTFCTCEKKAPESTKCHLILINPDGGPKKDRVLVCGGDECVSPTVCKPQPLRFGNVQPLPNGGFLETVRCPCQQP